MSLSHRLPLVSAVAGPLSDGALIGAVNQSLYLGVFSDVRVASAIYAVAFDNTGGSNYAVSDVSGVAGNDAASDFAPFGATGSMGANDFVALACDSDVESMFVSVGTPGVYTGAIALYDSVDGVSFGRQLAITSDPSNGLRNAGIHPIVWTQPATPRVAFSPFPLAGVASRKWLKLGLTGLGAVTTAPLLTRVWLVHESGAISYVDLTASANGALTAAPASVSFFPTLESSTFYASDNAAFGEERHIFLAQANVRTRVIEFLTSSGWLPGTGVVDPSNDFTAGPTVSTVPPTQFAVRWTPPAGWASLPPPFTLPVGAAAISSAFWRRIRTTAVTTTGPTNSVQVRVRARQYGNANTSGCVLPSAETLRAVTVESIGATVGTGATTLSLANLTTGVARTLDIPAGPALPLNLDIADLAFDAGDQYGLFHVGGGASLQDVALHLHD